MRGGGPMLRPVVMCLAETQSDGPPGKSIPGILQEQQQNLGPGRLLGSLLNTQPEPYFAASVSRKLPLCFGGGMENVYACVKSTQLLLAEVLQEN